MNDHEFRLWLEARGCKEKSIETRVSAVRRIEQALARLGLPDADLDVAYDRDALAATKSALQALRADALKGGQLYRTLLPQSEKPINRLANFISWLGNYRSFREGRLLEGSDAEKIRWHVFESYIVPARERGDGQATVRVREVYDALSLPPHWRNICQAISGKLLQELANVDPPHRVGKADSSAASFVFQLRSVDFSFDAVLTELRQRYREIHDTDKMVSFELPDGRQAALERTARVQVWFEFDAAAGSLPTTEAEHYTAEQGRNSNLPLRLRHIGSSGIAPRPVVKVVMRDFPTLTATLDWYEGQATVAVPEDITEDQPAMPLVKATTNLILHGPPGTGKTYATASEAVRLCLGVVPGDREKLMQEYARLLASGRIEFVTFHQSYSYEEFVEGLRPVQSEGTTAGFRLQPEMGTLRRIAMRAEKSSGSPVNSGSSSFSIGNRKVFKMSIGVANDPEDNELFDDAVADGYALLGWANIDWSDDRYREREQIIEKYREHEQGLDMDEPTATSARVKQINYFRNRVRKDDVIVVSKGNALIRAIGVVTGDYTFIPRERREYAHQRPVHWLWVDRDGIPSEEIYSEGIIAPSIYELNRNYLNIPALERYINSGLSVGGGAPEPFVLIIDEINRANISKVFGELITLLEPDKRIGELNELRARLPYSRDLFGLPANLHIVGTMNTADRSIALLDTALRRRFEFRELMPDASTLQSAGRASGIGLQNLLSVINERVEYLFDREHQIGHAYFIGCASREDVDRVMRGKVIPLLAEYFYLDWAKVAAVLGDADGTGHFLERKALVPPAGVNGDDGGETRYRWSVKPVFGAGCYDQFQ